MPNAPETAGDVAGPHRVTGPSGIRSSTLQEKVCSMCAQSKRVETSAQIEDDAAGAFVCQACSTQPSVESHATPLQENTGPQIEKVIVNGVKVQTMAHTTGESTSSSKTPSTEVAKPTPPTLQVVFPTGSTVESVTSLNSPQRTTPHILGAVSRSFLEQQSLLDPPPLSTNVRISSTGYDSLYPGALFEGMQTNRSREHRVSVRIVDVNPLQSTLAGFLTIHDLTDQHPEITTFFDGQIIGQQYGFMTQDWGANVHVDTTHWQRFPQYHHIHPSELAKPKLTFKNPASSADRGFLFMRWKERFLVPDHRVRSINGASYAGFYYVCIEFDSSMGNLHADALNYHPPRDIEEEEEEEADCDADMADGAHTGGQLASGVGGELRQRRVRRSTSRQPLHLEDDKSPSRAYAYGTSPYASTSYAPSTSPVTGANRIRRASGAGSSMGRRRRLSIYTAGSVPAHVHDHGHHSHASPSSSTFSHGGRRSEMDEDSREMTLEEALALDLSVEQRARNRARQGTEDSKSRSRSASRYRSVERSRRDDEEYDGGYPYAYGKKSVMPARLTGFYYHSEKEICDMYQKLELHHVPERTKGCFEFR